MSAREEKGTTEKGTTEKGTTEKPSFRAIMDNARKSAFQGGLAGGLAMGVNVLSLMWLRTTMNYQYSHGTSITTALRTLYSQGGIPRFYRGLAPALVQGPMSRFGDTAANAGVLSLWSSYPELDKSVPTAVKTISCSVAAGLFRIGLMPIDSMKTSMQVQGSLTPLIVKLKTGGPQVLFHGSIAASTATFVGHYPWFFTYNMLNEKWAKQDDRFAELGRRAAIGFTSSAVSDTTSNSIRVIKTFKQTQDNVITYPEAVKQVLAKDGINGLMFRGLETKILSNGLQGICFSILWKQFEDMLSKK